MPRILAAAAISPPLQPELAHAAVDDTPILGRALLAFYRREVLAVPAKDLPEPLRRAARAARSLTQFETEVTTPRFGYPSYAVFCELNRPAAVLPRLRIPTLVMMAADDPLVPLASMEGIDWRNCPAVLPLAIAGGGHCGFYDWRAESLSLRVLGGFFEGAAEAPGAGAPNRVRPTPRQQPAAAATPSPARSAAAGS
jgi:predicted alpha/beta-fold hydrolase